MWGLIILWKKKCCLWVATDLNYSISSKALSGSLSSCSSNSAFVGFLIRNRIGPLRHICAGMFSLIFTWTQAVRILMQVWCFFFDCLDWSFQPPPTCKLQAHAGKHLRMFLCLPSVFHAALCWKAIYFSRLYSFYLCEAKMQIVLSIIYVWLMIKAGVKHLMTTGNRTWYSWEGSAVCAHPFSSGIFIWLHDHIKHSHSCIFFCCRIRGSILFCIYVPHSIFNGVNFWTFADVRM